MAKCIMVQGTMSSAGKSLLCTALCRIFHEDGYRTAPFKSQNMALNSFVTADGGEMGRAQAVQAQAAGVEPDVRMNPILLKPSSDVGSQVVVMGRAQGHMRAMAYYAHKRQYLPIVQKAYASLASDMDILVIEGAGSPVELNLREGDMVNMGLAALVDAPVLLVGDIDRGGVFAQLYGTVALLSPDERQRVRGLVINKFRGDRSLFAPGVAQIEELCKVPVLGVLPYLPVMLDDEDSLSERLQVHALQDRALDIAVVRLPRISNFTDFAPLTLYDQVSLRYISTPRELLRHQPDLIFLPGSKSTMSDLRFLRETGLEAAILRCHAQGSVLFGICGGFQMLGKTLCDPDAVESAQPETVAGLGLLDLDTHFQSEKIQRQVTGVFPPLPAPLEALSGLAYQGYEIHMGYSHSQAPVLGQNRVFGSYIHGLFDAPGVADALVRSLLRARGLSPEGVAPVDPAAFREQQFQILANAVRESLDMPAIYQILEGKI